MPVRIREGLPAAEVLAAENVFVMTEGRAATQDIRPLHILVLNLMPAKQTTEAQLLRMLGNTPLQVEVTFLHTASYSSRNTDHAHLADFYETFEGIRANNYDGLIITGAPVELMRFEDVTYWDELVELMAWADTHVYSTLAICWAAQAELYHHYGIAKHEVAEKVFGVFRHQVTDPKNKITRGFDDTFLAPHSRHTTVEIADLLDEPDLELLAASSEAGVYLAASRDGRRVFVTGHPEYDASTLDREYRRDLAAGLPIDAPRNYYRDDDPDQLPVVSWRAHGDLLFANWLNYCVYQETPYDLHELAECEPPVHRGRRALATELVGGRVGGAADHESTPQ